MCKFLIPLLASFLFSAASVAAENNALDRFLDCVAINIPTRSWSGVDLTPKRLIELEGDFVFIHGAIGWHTTWGVLLDTKVEAPLSYETYGAQGDLTRAFGRMAVPTQLIRAIQDCGSDWHGVWQHEWPKRAPLKAAVSARSDAQYIPLLSADGEVQLPPK